jgi:hypothetical protein
VRHAHLKPCCEPCTAFGASGMHRAAVAAVGLAAVSLQPSSARAAAAKYEWAGGVKPVIVLDHGAHHTARSS